MLKMADLERLAILLSSQWSSSMCWRSEELQSRWNDSDIFFFSFASYSAITANIGSMFNSNLYRQYINCTLHCAYNKKGSLHNNTHPPSLWSIKYSILSVRIYNRMTYLSSDTLTWSRSPLCSDGGGAGVRVSLASPRSNNGYKPNNDGWRPLVRASLFSWSTAESSRNSSRFNMSLSDSAASRL